MSKCSTSGGLGTCLSLGRWVRFCKSSCTRLCGQLQGPARDRVSFTLRASLGWASQSPEGVGTRSPAGRGGGDLCSQRPWVGSFLPDGTGLLTMACWHSSLPAMTGIPKQLFLMIEVTVRNRRAKERTLWLPHTCHPASGKEGGWGPAHVEWGTGLGPISLGNAAFLVARG